MSAENGEFLERDLLGEYKDQFVDIKLLENNINYDIYRAFGKKENLKVILKVIDINHLKQLDYDYHLNQIKREEEILGLCESENILKLYRRLETKNKIIFVLENYKMNLAEYIVKYRKFENDLEKLRDIILGIGNALKVLNKNGVIHRDIKPQNIFLIENDDDDDEDDKKDVFLIYSSVLKYKVKLGGFGCSIMTKDNNYEKIGTLSYAAPEIIKSLKYDEK